MGRILGLLYTSLAALHPIMTAAREVLPSSIKVRNLVDEGILQDLMETNRLNSRITRRVCQHVQSMEESGAEVVLLTCSSISPCADIARYLVEIPVLKIDEAMLEKALEMGKRVGVIATLPTTLEPTVRLLGEKSKNGNVTVKKRLCSGAFDALVLGDADTHDRLLLQEIVDLSQEVDVVVLAQATMDRLIPLVQGRVAIPVLSSPLLAMQKVKTLLAV